MDLLLSLKILFIFLIYIEAFLAGIIPAFSKKCRNSQKFLSLANAFAGGVFLSIALIHVLPEAVTSYITWKADQGVSEPFPLPFFLVFSGYTFILIIDKVMFDSHAILGGHDHGGHGGHEHGGHSHGEEKGHSHGHGHDKDGDHHHDHTTNHGESIKSANRVNVSQYETQADVSQRQAKKNKEKYSNIEVENYDPATTKLIRDTKASIAHMHQKVKASTTKQEAIRSMIQEQKDITEHIRSYLSNTDKFAVRMSAALNHKSIHNVKKSTAEQSKLFVDAENVKLTDQIIQEEEDEHVHKKKKGCCTCDVTPFVLMIALCVHATFEGLALGLNKDLTTSIDLMIAIGIHKGAEGVSLSISLAKAFGEGQMKKIFWMIFSFAFATPTGVALGILLGEAPDIIDITFTSLAGGTFLYIACNEVITEEFSLPGNRWYKLLAMLLGAGIITCLWFLDK